ncbi:cation:proton antiporter [Paratractidigestivibacter sp.]|uniref:cation:proton antiporter n=1 Tax=Paratractidigestivibacter sp. TaxID=2847316 RepID=UPI002ABDA5F2|nr:cation:proton antiporter [Paratractidigestivibacter sp.]
MVANLCMLAVMMIAVVAASFVASLIPGRPVPEVVFFVVAGVIVGPNCLGIVQSTPGLDLVSRLGMGFLFLMAGYELDLRELTGTMGRHASVCWAASFGIALLVVPWLRLGLDQTGCAAFAIALTTTAYGTLVPIMRDRELAGTSVGEVIESYGAMGEIWPVVAMSVLLSPSRSLGANVAVLLGFIGFCALVAVQGATARDLGSRLSRFLHENAESSSQPTLRAVVALLCALLALAAVLDLDAVLAAFAAGFILRHVMPADHGHRLMDKVEALGNGLFVPVFFVYSGIGINFRAVGENPGLLVGFMALLLLVRALPLLVSLTASPETRTMPLGEKISASLYCTMALPLIVALTEAAVAAGAMDEAMASVLVCAGALTVLVIPVITSLSVRAVAAHPIDAVHEMAEHPHHMREIIHEHHEHAHERVEELREERQHLREEGVRLSSADFLARRAELRRRHRRR